MCMWVGVFEGKGGLVGTYTGAEAVDSVRNRGLGMMILSIG